MPWRNDSKSQIRDIPPPMPYMDLDARFDHELPVYGRSQTVGVDLKGKGRSYSSPLPLSALDIIPTVPTDIFTPIPIVPQNFFDEVLPRELRLRVLFCLLELHEAEHERAVKYGRWSVSLASASKSKWVGKDRGVRELIKFSRVSASSKFVPITGTNVSLDFESVAGSRIRWSDVEQSGPTCISQDSSFPPYSSIRNRRHIC